MGQFNKGVNMVYTLWGKNETNIIWNFVVRSLYTDEYGCDFNISDGLGYKKKLTTTIIGNDFITTETTSEIVSITGTATFRDPMHIKLFENWHGNKPFKLFYDPKGFILPDDQISAPFYKYVQITEFKHRLMNKDGLYPVSLVLQPSSAKWKSDTIIGSTISGISENPLYLPYYYPAFYQQGQRLYVNINNIGDEIGCVVKITNKNITPLTRAFWTVDSGNKRQYAEWLAGTTKLEQNRTLIIDSRPLTERAIVEHGEDITNVRDEETANVQYIGFVSLLEGENIFSFDLGTVKNVDVVVEYTLEAGIPT